MICNGHNYALLTCKQGTAFAISSEEWHRRFSHLCPQLMAKIKDKVGNVAMKQCEVCPGKDSAKSIPS